MLAQVLGWATVGWIALTAVGASWWLWIAGQRPWRLRTQVYVPGVEEALVVQWESFEQDTVPIPWT